MYLFHENESKSRFHWTNFEPLNAAVSKWKPLAGYIGPECMWISRIDGSSILQAGYRISQEKNPISIKRLVSQFPFVLGP